MKTIGVTLIFIGLAALCYLGISYFKDREKVISPIPEERGVKVIFITPSK